MTVATEFLDPGIFSTEPMDFHAGHFLKSDTSSGSPFNKAANFWRYERGRALQHYAMATFSFLGPVREDGAEIGLTISCRFMHGNTACRKGVRKNQGRWIIGVAT